jgi:hypothetical protein
VFDLVGCGAATGDGEFGGDDDPWFGDPMEQAPTAVTRAAHRKPRFTRRFTSPP